MGFNFHGKYFDIYKYSYSRPFIDKNNFPDFENLERICLKKISESIFWINGKELKEEQLKIIKLLFNSQNFSKNRCINTQNITIEQSDLYFSYMITCSSIHLYILDEYSRELVIVYKKM